MYTVINVDDEPMVKKTLRKLIDGHSSFRVIGEAEDGKEALAFIREREPDLVITDISMPVMDGLELIKEVRERNIRSEIVILTGYDDFGYAQEGLRQRVADYILKPIRPEALTETLDRIALRLSREKQRTSLRSEWLPSCLAAAGQIADALWTIQEQEALALLHSFHRNLTANRLVDADVYADIYTHLLLCISKEMTGRGLEGLTLDAISGSLLPHEPEQWLLYSEERLANILDEIRKSRHIGEHPGIRGAIAYISAHYDEDHLTLQEAAAQAGMSSVAHFSRTFKEEAGVSFMQYVTGLRMEKARQLLADPACKTYEAANLAGYPEYAHFAKVFKKYWGETPGEFRKRLASDRKQ